ncbi:MAG: DUF3034 family protein [Hyphomonadaceae bacterium]|nr:DUF3034 family protein [Hyphomonadaceae bacterium]
MTAVPALALGLLSLDAAEARPLVHGGKLLLTRGVSTIEGAAGGGLSTWSLVSGNETEDGIGGSAFATVAPLPDFELRAYGAAVGFHDRLEVSYARQEFHTGSTGRALGLRDRFTFEQDVIGVKLRVAGDAVYDQDRLMPQIAVGAQFKTNSQEAVVRAVGAASDDGIDYYVTATKLLLSESMLVSGALRWTEANQAGLLGFGGDRNDGHSLQAEAAVAYMLSRRFIVGGEYRTKPDNLRFAKEDDAFDLFAAYALTSNLSGTLAYVDLGDIATREGQRGVYVSLQVGY